MLAVLLAACGPGPSPPEQRLDIERLVFVPGGDMSPFVDVVVTVPADLLVDRFEVTTELWREVATRGGAEIPTAEELLTPELGAPQAPVVGMTLEEASRFARARAMRLPTVAEWLFVAAGTRAQFWPYRGRSQETSVANTSEVRLGRAVPVGTFPRGQTSDTGVHDMLGNVWEWTVPPLPVDVEPSSWWLTGRSTAPYWAMGGSFLSPARPLFGLGGPGGQRRVYHARGLESGERATDVGLRCCADAEEYLRGVAGSLSRPALRARIVAVGELWGSRAVPLLERLVEEPGAPEALAWLLEGAML